MKKIKKSEENIVLVLPEQGYGPICNRLLKEFISHHKLPKLTLPEGKCSVTQGVSIIVDIMLHSMGQEKRLQLIKDVEEYKKSLYVQMDIKDLLK